MSYTRTLPELIASGYPFTRGTVVAESIRVLSTYPLDSRDADGNLTRYKTGDRLSRILPDTTELNRAINADANALTDRYMTTPWPTGYSEDWPTGAGWPRTRDDDWIVYYLRNRKTGNAFAGITLGGRLFLDPSEYPARWSNDDHEALTRLSVHAPSELAWIQNS